MEFNKENFKNLIDEMNITDDFKLSDIPNVDLYMDQVITLFEDKFSHFKRDEASKLLTKTMVNNYIKAKTLMNAKNKKYTKDHMIVLILIFHLKQLLSINDIKTLLLPIIENDTDKCNALSDTLLEEILLSFNSLEKAESENIKNEMKNQYELIEEIISGISLDNKEKTSETNDNMQLIIKILMVLDLTYRANIQKRLAEKIIDTL